MWDIKVLIAQNLHCCRCLDNKEINMRGPGTSEEIQGSKDIKFLLRNTCRCH